MPTLIFNVLSPFLSLIHSTVDLPFVLVLWPCFGRGLLKMNFPDYLQLIFYFLFLVILIEMDIINNFYAATSWSVRRSWICKCLSFGLVFSYSWLLWCWWNRVQTKPAQVRGLKQPLYKDWAADVGVGRGHGRSSMEEICRVRTCTEKEDREKLITLLIQELRGNKWTQEMAGLQTNWSRLVTQHVFQLWSFVMCSYEY